MFKQIRNEDGQALMTEYIVIFFLVIGALVAMTTFVQRTLQGRLHDARNYMLNEAAKAHEGPIPYEYEPYYGSITSNVARMQDDETHLLGGGGTGIFRKFINQEVDSSSLSVQAPPKDSK